MNKLEILIAFIVKSMMREHSYFKTPWNGEMHYGTGEKTETVIDGRTVESYYSEENGYGRLSVKNGETSVKILEYWSCYTAGPTESRFLAYGFHGRSKDVEGELYTSTEGSGTLYEEGYRLLGFVPEEDAVIIPRLRLKGLKLSLLGKPSAEYERARREDLDTLISIHG